VFVRVNRFAQISSGKFVFAPWGESELFFRC
jgi:hypothetical protein